MRALIPHLIYDYYQQSRRQGQLEAVALFVDISGFTPLTETLMRHGKKDGAEVLSAALNSIFRPLVSAVYDNDGFITTFAGDAFTALFPFGASGLSTSEAAHQAARTAFFMQQVFQRQGTISTAYGDFHLSAKVGLGLGAVEWGIPGAHQLTSASIPRYTYFFRGAAIAACVASQEQAEQGEVIASQQIAALLAPAVAASPRKNHFQLEPPGTLAEPRQPVPLPLLAHAVMTAFYSDTVLEITTSELLAEFREVTPIFLSFDDKVTWQVLNAFIIDILRLCNIYGGYFNRLDFGDKGGFIMLLFGAPLAHERGEAHAADFLLALRELSHMPWRAGLTCGTVYAGLIGGIERCEYTAIGDIVNLAARLAMKADWGEIWVSPQATSRLHAQGYELEAMGRFSFKGKSNQLAIARLQSGQAPGNAHQQAATAPPAARMVGRENQFDNLLHWLQPIFQHQFAGIITIYGEAGTGKSLLAAEARWHLAQQKQVRWLLCTTEELMRQSLNPFKHMVASYFDQSPARSIEQNETRFRHILNTLIASVRPRSETIAQELERTRSFLGALVNLHWPGSLYEELEPRLRFENTLLAMRSLLQAESLQQPLVLQIEDIHWIDPDSHELVAFLLRALSSHPYPIALLCTSRYQEDGSRVVLAEATPSPRHLLDLGMLPAAQVRGLAEQTLQGHITDQLLTFLVEKTQGSPFFVEQLLEDLLERGAIVPPIGRSWDIYDQHMIDVPLSINAVLVARLDRLTMQVKQVVQTAAVLGREFEVQVLSRMLRGDKDLTTKIQTAEQRQIWALIRELRYLFRHTLLRDAAYDMQLRARLREMHLLAAEAIEQLYAADLAPHFGDLAYHYGKTGDTARERSYAHQAGERAAARYANAEALFYLSRALELTPATDLAGRYLLLLTREQVYDRQGNRRTQLRDLAELTALALRLDDPQRQAEIALRQANYSIVTGDYTIAAAAAQRAIELTGSGSAAAHAVLLHAEGYLHLGRIGMFQADYEEAQQHLQQALELAQAHGAQWLQAESIRQIGIVVYYQGDIIKARTCDEQALQICRDMGDRQGEAKALDALGSDVSVLGNLQEAYTYYQQALQLYQAIGHQGRQGVILGNLGQLYQKQAEYSQAIPCYEQGLEIVQTIDDHYHIGWFLGSLGWVYLDLGDYARAGTTFAQAVHICRSIGARGNEGWVLSGLALLAVLQAEYRPALEHAQQALQIAQESGEPASAGDAWIVAGHALRGLQQWQAAADAYQHALTSWHEVEEWNRVVEARAGLAALKLAQGDISQAQAHNEAIVRYLQEDPLLIGTDEPFRVYLACYQVLHASQDARASEVLRIACRLLRERAAKIADEQQRHLFLHHITVHRTLLAACQYA